jgi:hypothetical protein
VTRVLGRKADAQLHRARVIVKSFRDTKGHAIALEAAEWLLSYNPVVTYVGRHRNDMETKRRLGVLLDKLRHRMTPEDLLVACLAWMLWNRSPHGPHVDSRVETFARAHLAIPVMQADCRYKDRLQPGGRAKHALGEHLQKELVEYVAPMAVIHQKEPEKVAGVRPAMVRPDAHVRMKQLWATPEYRAAMTAKLRAAGARRKAAGRNGAPPQDP